MPRRYFIFPKAIGGGGRSYERYSIPEKLAKTGEAAYSMTRSKNAVSFHAVSLQYPSCTIDVHVDSIGQMKGWTYKGEFQ